jgi:hypothetical protein
VDDRQRQRNRKWLVLGTVGFVTGTATMLVVRSIPMAAGTAAAIVVALVVLKHVGLFIAIGSPLTALMQFARPRLLALCGRSAGDE